MSERRTSRIQRGRTSRIQRGSNKKGNNNNNKKKRNTKRNEEEFNEKNEKKIKFVERKKRREKKVKKTIMDGLYYVPNFISKQEALELLDNIDSNEEHWIFEQVTEESTLNRRTMQYGWKYNYLTREVDKMSLSVPDWLKLLIQRLEDENHYENAVEDIENVIINEYHPNQGITSHVDRFAFGSIIAGITLNSGCYFEFSNVKNPDNVVEVYLQPQSLYIMTGKARYEYRHCIRARSHDVVKGRTILRGRRVSITLRGINHDYKQLQELQDKLDLELKLQDEQVDQHQDQDNNENNDQSNNNNEVNHNNNNVIN
eukprot:TRINITY_DN1109_c0_g1_i2.p1 TRINITY_DN1109_c0_g1~~TRINITY_DN1109_c0_g1_i2.p1  ORF type:complete len:314 (-),score=90.96 TRINITY_DN1109_c0_g1_i2:106-1047(-)